MSSSNSNNNNNSNNSNKLKEFNAEELAYGDRYYMVLRKKLNSLFSEYRNAIQYERHRRRRKEQEAKLNLIPGDIVEVIKDDGEKSVGMIICRRKTMGFPRYIVSTPDGEQDYSISNLHRKVWSTIVVEERQYLKSLTIPDYIKKKSTRELLKLLSEEDHYYKRGRSYKYRTEASNQIRAELLNRPHIPSKNKSRKNRQERAKKKYRRNKNR